MWLIILCIVKIIWNTSYKYLVPSNGITLILLYSYSVISSPGPFPHCSLFTSLFIVNFIYRYGIFDSIGIMIQFHPSFLIKLPIYITLSTKSPLSSQGSSQWRFNGRDHWFKKILLTEIGRGYTERRLFWVKISNLRLDKRKQVREFFTVLVKRCSNANLLFWYISTLLVS